jgi:sensor histidine kinase YesM
MSGERAAAVLAGAADGLGIANVQARLLASFGPRFGLEIDSLIDEGTTVTMNLPESVREPAPA